MTVFLSCCFAFYAIRAAFCTHLSTAMVSATLSIAYAILIVGTLK
jgi:hypothetical protein